MKKVKLKLYVRWCIRCHKFSEMSGKTSGRRVCDDCKKSAGRNGALAYRKAPQF